MHDHHFIIGCYGYQEYISERLHIQKYLLGDSLHDCVPILVLLSKSKQFSWLAAAL